MAGNEYSWTTDDGLFTYACLYKPEKAKGIIAHVHGLGEHSGRYGHVAEFFNNAGYVFSTFDLRGHGKSGGIRGHASGYSYLMDDIDTLLQKTICQFPGIPVYLYGHSMGGSIVLYYALTRNPTIKGIIVTSPGLQTAEPLPVLKMAAGKFFYKFFPTLRMSNGLNRDKLSRDPNIVSKYKSDPLVYPNVSARLGMDIIQNGQWIMQNSKLLSIPALIMQGTEDQIVNPEATRIFAESSGQRTTFKAWDGLYHELHNEPEKLQVLNHMKDWLDVQG